MPRSVQITTTESLTRLTFVAGRCSSMLLLATAVSALVLALVHLVAWRLKFLGGYPRSIWLSIGAGISVAYVFIFLLPELSAYQEVVEQEAETPIDIIDQHIYLAALAGVLVFYGLEHVARTSRERSRILSDGDVRSHRIFWIHVVSYGVYNSLIGYLLFSQFSHEWSTLIFFSVAMAVHFTVNDYAFREHHRDDYTRFGQWILAAAVLIGWGLSVAVDLPEPSVALVLAFVFGGLIINLLKEELPEERSSRFWAFLLGAAIYSLLLLAL
jgi:hypothetical protein